MNILFYILAILGVLGLFYCAFALGEHDQAAWQEKTLGEAFTGQYEFMALMGDMQ